jgi:hypothetical protein
LCAATADIQTLLRKADASLVHPLTLTDFEQSLFIVSEAENALMTG